jgi:hypothetical protein
MFGLVCLLSMNRIKFSDLTVIVDGHLAVGCQRQIVGSQANLGSGRSKPVPFVVVADAVHVGAIEYASKLPYVG